MHLAPLPLVLFLASAATAWPQTSNRPPTITVRQAGGALRFDGVNDYVAMNAAAFSVRSNLTVTAWFRNTDDFLTPEYNGHAAGNYLVSKGVRNYSPYNDYALTLSPDTNLAFAIFREDGTWSSVYSRPLTEAPHHAAGVYDFDHGRLSLYVDGVLAAETNASGLIRTAATDLFVGDWNGSSSWHFWHGEIDEVRLWNVARSMEDIRREMRLQVTTNEPGLVAHWGFNEGSGNAAVDQSGLGHPGTLVNSPTRLVSSVPLFASVVITNPGWAQLTLVLDGQDADLDPVTAVITSLPGQGMLHQTTDGFVPGAAITNVPTAVTSPNRWVIYRRQPGYAGPESFRYQVTDGMATSSEALVSFDVDAPSGPALRVRLEAGMVVLQWRIADGPCAVQRAETLIPPIRWQPVAGKTKVQDGFYETQFSAVGGAGFYRLACPGQ